MLHMHAYCITLAEQQLAALSEMPRRWFFASPKNRRKNKMKVQTNTLPPYSRYNWTEGRKEALAEL